jgi:hypothetical protein
MLMLYGLRTQFLSGVAFATFFLYSPLILLRLNSKLCKIAENCDEPQRETRYKFVLKLRDFFLFC